MFEVISNIEIIYHVNSAKLSKDFFNALILWKGSELFCTAGHTCLPSVLYVGRLYIVLAIELFLQHDADNSLSKDGNVFSFVGHGQTVVTAPILRIRGLDFDAIEDFTGSILLSWIL